MHGIMGGPCRTVRVPLAFAYLSGIGGQAVPRSGRSHRRRSPRRRHVPCRSLRLAGPHGAGERPHPRHRCAGDEGALRRRARRGVKGARGACFALRRRLRSPSRTYRAPNITAACSPTSPPPTDMRWPRSCLAKDWSAPMAAAGAKPGAGDPHWNSFLSRPDTVLLPTVRARFVRVNNRLAIRPKREDRSPIVNHDLPASPIISKA